MNKINKIIIPIAGYGSRMFPETLLINKALLPIANKPSIIHILEEIRNAGINNVIFIISPIQKDIIDLLKPVTNETTTHFPNNKEICEHNDLMNYFNFSFVIQQTANGLGDAIYQAKNHIDNEYFGVILGDNVMTNEVPNYGIGELISAFDNQPANYIGVIHVNDDETKLYGIVNGNGVNNNKINVFPLSNIVEKPKTDSPSNYACLGRYIFDYHLFDYLDSVRIPNSELILPDAIAVAMQKETVFGVKLSGKWLDVGNKIGFIKSNIDYALHNKEIKEIVIKHLKDTYNINIE